MVPPPPLPASYSVGTVGSVLGVKWLGREADNYFSYLYEVRNAWSNTSNSYIPSWFADT
jgi:hypothetical protein